jgi:hypothetical protein
MIVYEGYCYKFRSTGEEKFYGGAGMKIAPLIFIQLTIWQFY